MIPYQIILGYIAVILSIISYVPYIHDVLKNKTRPHIFMWILWSLLSGITYFIQIYNNAGAGSWSMGISTIACLFIFIISIKRGEKRIVLLDWICFLGALIAIGIWLFTVNQIAAVILTTFTAILSFIPTFRKSWSKPQEETGVTFSINATKWIVSLLALTAFNFSTVLYLVTVIILNTILALVIYIRRWIKSVGPNLTTN